MLRRPPLLLPTVLLAALAAAAPTPAASQVVSGVVVDGDTGAPVPVGRVVLLDSLDAVRAEALADLDGRFAVAAPAPGTYRLHATRMGYYDVLSDRLAVAAGDVRLRVALAPAPVAVEGLEVTTERRDLSLDAVDFYDRQSMGLGHFLTAEEIDGRPGMVRMGDLLREIPGVRIVESHFGHPRVLLRGTPTIRNPRGLCEPALVLDGIRIDPPWTQLVTPRELEGVEVYARALHVPVMFGAVARGCGVIVAWTRRGE